MSSFIIIQSFNIRVSKPLFVTLEPWHTIIFIFRIQNPDRGNDSDTVDSRPGIRFQANGSDTINAIYLFAGPRCSTGFCTSFFAFNSSKSSPACVSDS